ncbi:MAG: hypothetical protein ABL889_12610 [Terricaulis sp.]
MRLLDEIMRCAPVFDRLDEASLANLSSPQLRALIRTKNGALALSGALALFGCGRDASAPMHIARYRNWCARADYGLQSDDDVFGADVFGDLLFSRNGAAFRLDGETGDHVEIGMLDVVLNQQLSEIAEELGGNLGRERFANRGIGADPLRLLPTYPFMMKEHVRGEFFETPLSHAIDLKHRLFVASRDAPEVAGIDCSFWRRT